MPVQKGDCLDKAVCGGMLVGSAQEQVPTEVEETLSGDFQNSAAQGPEHPDLSLKLAMR